MASASATADAGVCDLPIRCFEAGGVFDVTYFVFVRGHLC